MTRTVAWCLLMGYALQGAGAEPKDFRFRRDIELGKSATDRLVSVVLPSDVYAATRDGYPDLRIFDGQGRQTPCLAEMATQTRTHTVRAPCRSHVASLKEREDGIELVVQLEDESPAADGLTIWTPLADYERRVRVFGSTSGRVWTPLVNGLIFDYSRYMDLGNRELSLPENDFRRLKVVISGIADAKDSPFLELTRKYRGGTEAERIEKTVVQRRPFRMDRIDLWRLRSEQLSERPREVNYPVEMSRVEEDAAGKSTIVYLRSRREPLTEFTLETSSRNFSRAARVQVPVRRGVRMQWADISQGRVSLVDFGGYRSESLGLSFPEQRQDEYRIVICNEDSPPLEIKGVKARGNEYRLVLLAAGNETYRLCYGADEVGRPEYDAAAVLGPLQLRGNRPTEAPLGKEIANPAVGPPSFALRGILNNALFLGAVVVLLVAALGWALFRATRRINALPKE
jgi:hypothetical protein